MGNALITEAVAGLPQGTDFANRIDWTIRKYQQMNKPFFVILLQIQNLESYAQRHPRYVTLNLFKELYQKLRKSVHSSQFIGTFQNGFGLVIEGVDAGQVDNISRWLVSLAMKVIREGQYNDLTTRWTEIIRQFLFPTHTPLIMPKVGWAIYPRDGNAATQLVKRALCHVLELSRR